MFSIVINKQGYKVEFVALNENKEPQFYTLKDGEYLIEQDWQIANSMGKPRWTGTEWFDEEPPKQIDNCSTPTDNERIAKLEEEKSILAENVYQLANIIEVMLGDVNNG